MKAASSPQGTPVLPDSFFWLLLAAVAGAVNAGAYLSCQRFVSHVTGTATLIGVDLGSWELALDYTLVLACFCAGAAAAVVMIDGKKKRKEASSTPALRPWFQPTALVSAIVALVAVAGEMDAFGPFGTTVETAADFVLLSALGFSMGLLNAAVGRSANNQRITHLTGEATDLGVQLAAVALRSGTARKEAFVGATVRAGKITAFIVGAAIVAALAPSLEFLSFLVPCALAVTAMGLSIAVDRHAVSRTTPAVEIEPARARLRRGYGVRSPEVSLAASSADVTQ